DRFFWRKLAAHKTVDVDLTAIWAGLRAYEGLQGRGELIRVVRQGIKVLVLKNGGVLVSVRIGRDLVANIDVDILLDRRRHQYDGQIGFFAGRDRNILI